MLTEWDYFTSTLAPLSSSSFLIFAASSLLTPPLTSLGAPSTRSLASFRPRPVTARTSLMMLILFAPASLRTTVNSVFSSAAAAAGPAAATATGAAAETPHFSSSSLDRSAGFREHRQARQAGVFSKLFDLRRFLGSLVRFEFRMLAIGCMPTTSLVARPDVAPRGGRCSLRRLLLGIPRR